jgi:hypothetical protein
MSEFNNNSITKKSITFQEKNFPDLTQIGKYEIKYYILMSCRDTLCKDSTDNLKFNVNILDLNQTFVQEYNYTVSEELRYNSIYYYLYF